MPITQNTAMEKTASRTTARPQKQDAITLLAEDDNKVKKIKWTPKSRQHLVEFKRVTFHTQRHGAAPV